VAGRGRPKAVITVPDEDRVVLKRWSKRPKSPMSVAQRARIVLLAADGLNNNVVAERVGVNQATVVKWRKRYAQRGVDGLIDEPRPGAPRTITDDAVAAVVVRTLEEVAADARHWSTRDLAKNVGMSPSSVGRIWHAFGLKPWLTDTWKLSDDPQFIDKVRDVVGIYLNPPEQPWCCASTRRPASRRSTGPGRRCPCDPASSNGAPMTMSATE
jgi:transposase